MPTPLPAVLQTWQLLWVLSNLWFLAIARLPDRRPWCGNLQCPPACATWVARTHTPWLSPSAVLGPCNMTTDYMPVQPQSTDRAAPLAPPCPFCRKCPRPAWFSSAAGCPAHSIALSLQTCGTAKKPCEQLGPQRGALSRRCQYLAVHAAPPLCTMQQPDQLACLTGDGLTRFSAVWCTRCCLRDPMRRILPPASTRPLGPASLQQPVRSHHLPAQHDGHFGVQRAHLT